MGTAIFIMISVVVVIILIFAGFKWVKANSVRLSLKWNCLEFEMRREDEPEPPTRAIKRS